MPVITVMIGGKLTTITNIEPYRRDLEEVRNTLKAIFVGFDPDHPERLIGRQEEIRTLANRAEELRFAVETWQGAEDGCANILAAWKIVQQIEGGAA